MGSSLVTHCCPAHLFLGASSCPLEKKRKGGCGVWGNLVFSKVARTSPCFLRSQEKSVLKVCHLAETTHHRQYLYLPTNPLRPFSTLHPPPLSNLSSIPLLWGKEPCWCFKSNRGVGS
eukprot:Sspe_Gene.59840::Locus_32912_Transcript_1_1_Confidence_1.000_Length_730::g.59840::m.59840